MTEPGQKSIDATYERLDREAESSGYHLNPDIEFTKGIIKGLLVNQERYGYWNCPCRKSAKNKVEDLDIICPCYYRDPDLTEHDACFCALYVSKRIIDGLAQPHPVPERRPSNEEREKARKKGPLPAIAGFKIKVWRCQVCGYICGRETPPEVCPVCFAERARFERIL